jgi:hypothetical protein
MKFLQANAGLLVLLGLTLLLRGGFMAARFEQLRDDPDDYHLIAHNMVRFATFSDDDPTKVGMYSSEPRPSAYRPPLYPVILSNLAQGQNQTITRQSIAILHVVLGVATVWMTWLIARALGLGWTSYFAAALVACDPILLNQQSLVMTETLAAACTALAWGLLVRFHFDRNWWNAGLAGGAIGLAALCRPTFLPWLAVAVVIAVCLQPGRFQTEEKSTDNPKSPPKPPPRRWALRWFNAAALLVGGLGVMTPWAIRNYQAFRQPLLTTTHGGYTLYLANNRHFYHYLRSDRTGLPWEPHTELEWNNNGLQFRQSFRQERWGWIQSAVGADELNDDDEFAVDRFQTNLAIEEIKTDPAGFLLAAWFRVRQLWTPLPFMLHQNDSMGRFMLRYLTAGWYLAVYGLALFAAYRLRWDLLRSPWLWGVSLCLIFTAVHVFYWCNLRMRAPLIPVIAVVAAAGLSRVGFQPVREA